MKSEMYPWLAEYQLQPTNTYTHPSSVENNSVRCTNPYSVRREMTERVEQILKEDSYKKKMLSRYFVRVMLTKLLCTSDVSDNGA
jgi:hypothetical protein